MKKTITIIGAGMMGSALAFPAAENGHTVRIVGTCLDDEIIDAVFATYNQILDNVEKSKKEDGEDEE